MALSARDRRAIILAATGLGIIGVYLLIIDPLAAAYGRLTTEHDRLSGQVAKVIRDQRKAEQYAAQLKKHEETAGELAPPKPYDEQITTVGSQIVMAAQMNGVMLKGSTPTAAVPWAEDPGLELATFVIDAEVMWQNMPEGAGDGGQSPEAAWENVFKFIAALYRIPGLLSVEQVDLTMAAGAPGGGPPGMPPGGAPGQPSRLATRLTASVLVAASPRTEERGPR